MSKIGVLTCKIINKTFVQGSPEEEREGGEASNLCCPAGAERRPRSLPEDCRQGNFPPVSLVVVSSSQICTFKEASISTVLRKRVTVTI